MKKVVVITGASKGIGLAIAQRMLLENYIVIGTSTNGKIKSIQNDNFYALSLDLSDIDSINSFKGKIPKQFKEIDFLINNAGIGPDLDTLYPEFNSFQKTFEVNVTGTVFFTEKLIKIIKEGGIVFNISSEMGMISNCERIDSVAYRMSKSALNMYTKILSNRLKDKIKVASIHPGWVKTTIAEDNIINGVLTPKQSANNIFNFSRTKFKTGVYWDTEKDEKLPW